MPKKYDYSEKMWVELGKLCTNLKGELSVQIPTGLTNKKDRIREGDFKVIKIKKIEFSL